MKKRIAIIGASYLQLPAVKKAQALGYEVLCFAWRKGAVCAEVADYFFPISTVDKEEILKVCQEYQIDGICTIASDTSTLAVNYVAERMHLVGNPDSYSEYRTNKYLMRQCFKDNNIPSPQFCEVLSDDDLVKCATLNYPIIVKPTDRSGSLGVEKVERPEDLPHAVHRAMKQSFKKQAIVEEFVGGREVSVESISIDGQHYILQITDKITTGEPFFVELAHHQPSNLPKGVQNKIRSIVISALNALKVLNGASHSELKITSNGDIKVIEIGARMGGDFIGSDLVKLSTGYDFLEGVIQIAMGEKEPPKITKHLFSGVFFLSEETKEILPIIKNWEKYPNIVKAEITDPVLHHIESSGDRSGYFIYQSKERRLEINDF